jgi:plastocyanin
MRTSISSFSVRPRLGWITLAILACILLVACGGGQTTSSSTPTTAPTPTAAPPTPTPTPTQPPTSSSNVTVVQMLENPPGHYFFQPASISITAGSIVVWVDNSDAPHTVTSDSGAPSSFNTTQNVTQNKTFALQFNQSGTYPYHCNIHPTSMKAVVDVTG